MKKAKAMMSMEGSSAQAAAGPIAISDFGVFGLSSPQAIDDRTLQGKPLEGARFKRYLWVGS